MIQLRAILLAIVLATATQAEAEQTLTATETLTAIQVEVAKLVEDVRAADVPKILVAPLNAKGPENILRSLGYHLLSKAEIKPALGLKGYANRLAVFLPLKQTLTSDEIAAGFALSAYFGRNCKGWRAASIGLFEQDPDTAEEMVLITLAALTFAPSSYISDRDRRKTRISAIIKNLVDTKVITPKRAEDLLSQPMPDPQSGSGC